MARSPSAFTLRSDARVRYSPAEREVFALLRESPRDSAVISRLRYGTNGAMPFNGRKIVIGALRSLVRKARVNGEPFRIAHSRRSGPIPMSFWLEKNR
jgi:hypothetical protein